MSDADLELIRLLDAYVDTVSRNAAGVPASQPRTKAGKAARMALLAYLERAYVRRVRLYDDGPHDPGDGSAYAVALEAESDPPIVAWPLTRRPITIRLSDATTPPDRATWPLRAMVGQRRYGSDGFSGLYNLLDCGHESSALHGGPVERMPDGRYGKRCRRCAEVIEHNERYDYDVRD